MLPGNKPGSTVILISPISEPYPYVSSGSFSGPAVPESPDPLVSYRSSNPQATDGLEIYLLKPKTVTTDTPSSFVNQNSLTGDTPNVTVNGTGSIMLDFGAQSAAWLEFDSPDCPGGIEMSNSPYTEVCVVNAGAQQRIKKAVPVKYQNTYRLELKPGFEVYFLINNINQIDWIKVSDKIDPRISRKCNNLRL